MNNAAVISAISISGCGVTGFLLGIIFFGGLWWTVRRRLSSAYLGSILLGSLLLRTLIVVAGFYLVSQRDWRRLLACLLGFLLARYLVTRRTVIPVDAAKAIARSAL